MRNGFIALLCITVLTFLTNCDDSSNSNENKNATDDNKSPTVQITAPAKDSTYTVGDTIEFTCSANDNEDGALSGESLVWSSDIDGQIGTGETCSTVTLSAGTHQITLTGTDGKGAKGVETIAITINAAPNDANEEKEDENTSPVVQITAPAKDSTYTAGDTIEFTGSAEDNQDGALSGESLVWSSDIDGQIGTGETCSTVTLSAGTHQITLTGTDADGAEGVETMAITVNAAPITGSLPDTGQTTSYTDTFGEDADYTINPHIYTKLDASGKALGADVQNWTMVKDNVTGLMWEVKTTEDGIHYNQNAYSWQDAQDTFIAQLNRNNFGGYSDWRLPTIKELSTLVHADSLSPALDTDYFPNTFSPYIYWSSTRFAYQSNESLEFMWCAEFDKGYVSGEDKLNTYYVRAVREDSD